ncbi:helix-turn-helix transcriptional regulator [Paenibacillus sp. HN-1]|uniref:helix-turn-helix transcriptional regulator n=1 Tax=Paenibacillus TaxID=44249 RepID=UPI001CA92B3C|nr:MULTISPECIES: helix-turn-helix transcriptional regulator [Paenibacillus]MBY9081055.1 helix-turn-helix transcriptional regulator [Paenibacillus sp. CGMCC 1.18879]MBY9087092.1 helix-turn-helix transcriptional regulator [Paenibacillus sinensis]
MTRQWLIDFRNSDARTQDYIAERTGISRQYYGMIEAGNRNPSVDLAKRIASVLRFDWTLFFADKGNEMLHKSTIREEVI